MKKTAILTVLALAGAVFALINLQPDRDARLKGVFRRPAQNGWIFVHLKGSPGEIGFQHGYLLAPEIREARDIIEMTLTHDTSRPWSFYRDAAKNMMWPRIEKEYQDEMTAMAEGVKARGVELDVWDIVTLNAALEWGYYHDYLERKQKVQTAKFTPPDRCSAFAATGSYTRDGKIVIAHNAWTGYVDGARWNIIFDIVPAGGHRMLMDGFPGFIHSGDDFGINAAGIIITETTITQFHGFDPGGIPEFARARKAMQYSSSIDDFARIMQAGNNGGYANNWLVADRNTGEIASLELGLKNVTLRRTKDGYFSGANFPVNQKLLQEETDFPPGEMGNSANARRVRWDQLMAEHRGKIDVEAAKRFLADHFDTFDKKELPSERTLCGHIDLSPRGSKPWMNEFAPGGAVQNKATDANMAGRMSLVAAMGHACGRDFRAQEHLEKHPEYAWQKKFLKDLKAQPWTVFAAVR